MTTRIEDAELVIVIIFPNYNLSSICFHKSASSVSNVVCFVCFRYLNIGERERQTATCICYFLNCNSCPEICCRKVLCSIVLFGQVGILHFSVDFSRDLLYIVLFPFFWLSSPSFSRSPDDCLRFLVYLLVGVSSSSCLL